MSSCVLVACPISTKKSAVNLEGIPSQVDAYFPLADFTIISDLNFWQFDYDVS